MAWALVASLSFQRSRFYKKKFPLSLSFHQCSILMYSFISHAIKPQQLTVSLNNTLKSKHYYLSIKSVNTPSIKTVYCVISLSIRHGRWTVWNCGDVTTSVILLSAGWMLCVPYWPLHYSTVLFNRLSYSMPIYKCTHIYTHTYTHTYTL